MSTKLDLKKVYKHLYQPQARRAEIIEVPALQYVMIDGEIEPGMAPGTSPGFQEALEALYGLSYTLKFQSKAHPQQPVDYAVMALEALWWVEGRALDLKDPTGWHWTAMILQPEHITPEMYAQALAALRKKKDLPGIQRLRFQTFHEGLSVQILHLGPYADEPASLERMHAYAAEQGYRPHGKHHEIYLSNPFRSAPDKLKTILRHPVEPYPPA